MNSNFAFGQSSGGGANGHHNPSDGTSSPGAFIFGQQHTVSESTASGSQWPAPQWSTPQFGSKRDRSTSPGQSAKRSRNGLAASPDARFQAVHSNQQANNSVSPQTATPGFRSGTSSTLQWSQTSPSAPSPATVNRERRLLQAKSRLKARQAQNPLQTPSNFASNPLQQQPVPTFLPNSNEQPAFNFSMPMPTLQTSTASGNALSPGSLMSSFLSTSNASSNPFSGSTFQAPPTITPLFPISPNGAFTSQPSNAAFLDAVGSNIPVPSIERSTQTTPANIAGSPFNAPFSAPYSNSAQRMIGDSSTVMVKEEDKEATSHTKSLFEMVANGQTRARVLNPQSTNCLFSHLSLPSNGVSESVERSSSERYDSPFATLPVLPSNASSMTLIGHKHQSQVSTPDTTPANSFDSDRTFRVPSEQLEQERVAIQERASITYFNSTMALAETSSETEPGPTTAPIAPTVAKASEIDVSSATTHGSASALPSASGSAAPPSTVKEMQPTKNARTDGILGNLRQKLNTTARVGIAEAREKAIAEVAATKASKSVSFELPPTDPSTPIVSFEAQPEAITATANEQETTSPDKNDKPSSTPANSTPVAVQNAPTSTVEQDQPPTQVHGSTAGFNLWPQVITPLNTAATTPRLAELLAELASIDTMRATKRSKFLDRKAEYLAEKETAEACNDRVWHEGVEWTWRAKLRMHNESMLDLAADRERLEEQIEEELRREAKAREQGRQKEGAEG